MQTINTIYDGNYFKPTEPIPVEGKYEVVITFIKPIDTKDTKCRRILKHFGTWNDEDVLWQRYNCMRKYKGEQYACIERT